MRGIIHFIIFAATVDIHTGDGSIIMQIPSRIQKECQPVVKQINRVGGGD